MIRISLAAGWLFAAPAHAQIVSIPQFTGTWSESWDAAPDGVCIDVAGGAVGTVCSGNMLASNFWQNWCTVNPYSGAQFIGSASGPAVFSFVTPIRRFGGWYQTHADNGTGWDVTIVLYDQSGVEIGRDVTPMANCAGWVWLGYESLSDDIWTVEVIGANGGAFALIDESEFSETNSPDVDGDGFSIATGDCDDTDATSYPGATELCDGADNDCDGVLPSDEEDGDSDGSIACEDCDDGDPNRFPGNVEACDGLDNDCDDQLAPDEVDDDGDGFSVCDGDCDDAAAGAFPGSPEVCDGLDTDCDGTVPADELDGDGDGFGLCAGDCDDGDPSVNPLGTEVPGDGIDQDCDGEDAPADGASSDTGVGAKSGGCGCTSSSSTMPAALTWIPLFLLARRREHRCAHSSA